MARKDTCRSGHAYTPENTRTLPNGSRKCRTCIRARQRMYCPPSGRTGHHVTRKAHERTV